MTRTLPSSLELLNAYAQGFFPMPHPETEEIEWYRPNPRAILPLDKFHCSRSLSKTLRQKVFSFSLNKSFCEVMELCSDRPETWINQEFKTAYQKLFDLGYAHSVEVWKDSILVGGVYGVQVGGAFFAESMFSKQTDASKTALYHLTQHLLKQQFTLLEVQFLTPHLKSLGAIEIPDSTYEKLLKEAIQLPCSF
jgi:leucyl/phenylalanyl-tRNA--protein transferase